MRMELQNNYITLLSPIAADDYIAVSTTVTFRAGSDGSQPSDAVCVEVPIINDNVFEYSEYFTLNIAAIDKDLVRVDEAQSQKILYIEDDDG